MTAPAPSPNLATAGRLRRPVARPEFLRLSNAIAGKKQPLRFTWNGQPAELVLTALKHALVPQWTAKVQLGGHEFIAQLHQMPELGWMAPELAGVDIAVLPEELACAVWQSCLGEVAAALAKAGVPLEVTSFVRSTGTDGPSGEFLEWAVNRVGQNGWLLGTLSAQEAGWQHLAELLAKAPVAPDPLPDSLPFSITLSAGTLRCKSSLLKELEVHDVLLADLDRYRDDRDCTLLLRGRPIGSAKGNQTIINITQINLNGTRNMAEPTNEPPALDELEVDLTFVVGHATVTLGELRALAPGAAFDLGAPLGEAVTIHANGRPIGKGELLEVGDRVGVRITELS